MRGESLQTSPGGATMWNDMDCDDCRWNDMDCDDCSLIYRGVVAADEADDVTEVLAAVSADELALVLARLAEGKVDGQHEVAPSGCGCLLGTVAMARVGVRPCGRVDAAYRRQVQGVVRHLRGVVADGLFRPAERAFFRVRPGDTPETSAEAAALDALLREVALSNPDCLGDPVDWEGL